MKKVLNLTEKEGFTEGRLKFRVMILPKSIEIFEEEIFQREGISSVLRVKIDAKLLSSKCPICMGPITPKDDVTFCTSCFTPHHIKCVCELIEHNLGEKCWNCEAIELKELI